MRTLTVTALWDEEAEVWVADSQDIPGLITEAPTQPELIEKLRILIPELLELNGVAVNSDTIDIPISLLCQQEMTLRIA